MRLERLTYNKIKVFLTFDDLLERGLTKEDLWQDAPKVQQLFLDMMTEASMELGFEADGPIAVEVFSLQAQGMVVIVTKENEVDDLDELYDEEYIEMQVTLDESEDILYEFQTFEDVLSLSKTLHGLQVKGGSLYFYRDRYYVHLEEDDIDGLDVENIISILAEFGSPSTITIYRIIEYGKPIMEELAVQTLIHYFK